VDGADVADAVGLEEAANEEATLEGARVAAELLGAEVAVAEAEETTAELAGRVTDADVADEAAAWTFTLLAETGLIDAASGRTSPMGAAEERPAPATRRRRRDEGVKPCIFVRGVSCILRKSENLKKKVKLAS